MQRSRATCDILCINRDIYPVEVSRYNFVRAKGKSLGTWLNINEIRNNRKNISTKKRKRSTYLKTKKRRILERKERKKKRKKEGEMAPTGLEPGTPESVPPDTVNEKEIYGKLKKHENEILGRFSLDIL